MPTYDHVWRVRTVLPERFGHPCRVVVYGMRLNSALVEFADGARYVTLRWFVRRGEPSPQLSLF